MRTGKDFKLLRTRLDLTQKAAARLARVSDVTLNHYEGNKRKTDAANIDKMWSALDAYEKEIAPAIADAGLNQDEQVLAILAHDIASLAAIMRDESISPTLRRQKLDSFCVGYVKANSRNPAVENRDDGFDL